MVAAIDPARLAGALLGARFEVLRKLGAGSASEVFEARGPLGELCAIKVLSAAHASSVTAARRLVEEGRALSTLDHPHLVKVLDAGVTADGRPYFTMARLHGETLRERLNRAGKLEVGLSCALIAGALSGLAAAHEAGIIHRDVKPSNIFLARDAAAPGGERAIVLDFGIAKIQGSSCDLTTARHILGTPRYLAPEQVLGGRVDARTDVYSMGIVLFEAIAGRWPYDATGVVPSMRAHLCEKPHLLRELTNAPPALERVITRALQKVPDKRWPSADAFAAALSSAHAPRASSAISSAISSATSKLAQVAAHLHGSPAQRAGYNTNG